MTLRLGLNGFGRIGRTVLRAALKRSDVQIVHINDLCDLKTSTHLLRYDSVHGPLQEPVSVVDGSSFRVGERTISYSACKNPAEIPWKKHQLDMILECSGVFTKREDVNLHFQAGARKVLISSPATGEDLTVVFGVNHKSLKPQHQVISNGSCTTNCLAPVAKIIHEAFGVLSGLMTTVHSYTNDQRILDLPHSDLRRARAGALSMIPTSTGAAKAIGLVLPELKGRIDGLAIRVPTPNVSLVDVTFQVKTPTTVEAVNQALARAAESDLKGVLGFTLEPLVSADYNGSTLSSVVDGPMTKVIDGSLVKILAWYDNETGFSHRMLDVIQLMAQAV